MAPRLLDKYRTDIAASIMKSFNIKNKMAVPRLDKIVINMGVGEALADIKILDAVCEELAMISGQKPVIRRAKKAIANFKVRQGGAVGCKVTLRRRIMYEFLDRFVNITLPRLRDFRGVPENSFDDAGNYTLGLSEQTIFPEIEYDKVKHVQGMDITFVIKNAATIDQAKELLKLFGMPFKTRKE